MSTVAEFVKGRRKLDSYFLSVVEKGFDGEVGSLSDGHGEASKEAARLERSGVSKRDKQVVAREQPSSLASFSLLVGSHGPSLRI